MSEPVTTMVQVQTDAGLATASRDRFGIVNGFVMWADGSSCTFRYDPLPEFTAEQRKRIARSHHEDNLCDDELLRTYRSINARESAS